MATIALVGNPNCGKTTLYNVLTGSRQHVGNWPGVTVERKSGFFTYEDLLFEVVDLPGVYSLNVASETAAVDENIACQFILNQQAEVVINILDASNLERHLYLTLQLIEMRVPLLVVVNMVDVARHRGMDLQVDRLAALLGCPVIPLQANKGRGLAELKAALLRIVANAEHREVCLSPLVLPYPEPIPAAIRALGEQLQALQDSVPPWLALRLLEEDVFAQQRVSPAILPELAFWQQRIRDVQGEDADILIADARYRFIQQVVVAGVARCGESKARWTARLDRVILNRVLGLPIFLAVMYFLFFFAINIGGAFQDFFDQVSASFFVDGAGYLLQKQGLPAALVILLAKGVGKGLNTVITFIPVLGALFLFLAFLEDSGYMARAAFVVDRLMRAFGLPGKAFVPMIIGFGCNVPAVMAARTLENKRDRILTIMMSPFMSCGARLAIYAVFTTAFFPVNGHHVVFALYLIGITMAVLTGFLLRRTLLLGQPAPLVMELPPYHLPQFSSLLTQAGQRLKTFIFRAGKLIVPVCIVMGMLQAFNSSGALNEGGDDFQSILSVVGRWVTPIFAPMGIQQDNWPATVGLMGGILAKEVVVGTLNALYSQLGHFSLALPESFHLGPALKAALLTIPANFSHLGHAVVSPLFSTASLVNLDHKVYGVMYHYFDGPVAAFSYLLFVLLYFPCVSTTAAMLRELDYRWAIFSILWMTGVAYGAAVIFYQAATIHQHWQASLGWIVGILAVFAAVIAAIHLLAIFPKPLSRLRARASVGVST
jgi:ferrous iron transport protein B